MGFGRAAPGGRPFGASGPLKGPLGRPWGLRAKPSHISASDCTSQGTLSCSDYGPPAPLQSIVRTVSGKHNLQRKYIKENTWAETELFDPDDDVDLCHTRAEV